jgi:O-acetylserine/cysteine efflux transporter
MAVAVTGIAVAAVDEGTTGPLHAFALVILGGACWGVSNVLTRRASPPDALNFMVWVSTVPVLPLLALSLLTEGADRDLAALRGLDMEGVGVILFIAWVSTVFGFGAWGWLIKRYPASTVAPFSLLVPVFGMASAWLLLDETVGPLRWTAAALLVAGVAMTSLVRPGRDRVVAGAPGTADSSAATPTKEDEDGVPADRPTAGGLAGAIGAAAPAPRG